MQGAATGVVVCVRAHVRVMHFKRCACMAVLMCDCTPHYSAYIIHEELVVCCVDEQLCHVT